MQTSQSFGIHFTTPPDKAKDGETEPEFDGWVYVSGPDVNMIKGNDFCIAVVDSIGATFRDKYGRTHSIAGFVQGHGDAPAIIAYSDWAKDWVVGAHEFFHNLGLGDSESPEDFGTIMYHLSAALGTRLKPEDKDVLYQYIIRELSNLTRPTYHNPNMDTVLKLRQQLNNPANEISFNRNNFK